MKILSKLLAGTAMIAASGATAQSPDTSPGGFYITGYGELSYFEISDSDDTIARTDLDMGISPGATNFPVGFSLGIDGFSGDGFDEYALYPAVTFGLGNGLISVGIPRSVFDKGYFPDRNFGGSSLLDLEFTLFTGSVLAAFYLDGSGFDPYGVRYDGEFANTKFGASYHQADDGGGTIDFVALAFQHNLDAIGNFDEVMFFGGLEYVEVGSSNITIYELGAEVGVANLRAGVSLGQLDFGGLLVDRASIYADYEIIDNLSVSGTYSSLSTTGSSSDFYSLGGEYRFANNGYVRANYTDGDLGDPLYEVTVGWRF